jgi:hypothetical protein
LIPLYLQTNKHMKPLVGLTPSPYCLDPCVSHIALPTHIIYFKLHDFDINNLNTTSTYTILGDITKFMVF